MKKYSVLLLALLAVSAYGKKVESKGLSLNTLNDSVNYALGFVNGCQIQSYQLKDDASPSVRNEFIDALQRGYDGKVQVRNEAQNIGSNIGQAIQSFERNGLVEKAAWTLNEKLLFQGLVNGLLQDTTMMPIMVARQYFQTQYEADSIPAPAAKGAKLVLSKCGFTAASVELKSRIDSLNYAFGLINGSEIYANALAKDSTKQGVKDLISALNESLQSKYKNPQLVNQGEQIGQAIKQQETVGLLNIPQLATNFALIKQGFLDGMNQKTALFTSATAGQYLQVTISNIQYGDNKAAGEQFLAENKLKEGVITTASGLQYKVITMGNGAKPTATDKVKVHYHGTLIDGTVFDSSVERGEPISFGLDQVIAGWTEGVQLMPVGSKFIFYIPQELAYGERAAGSIKPYSTLIFEVELLDIEQ